MRLPVSSLGLSYKKHRIISNDRLNVSNLQREEQDESTPASKNGQ